MSLFIADYEAEATAIRVIIGFYFMKYVALRYWLRYQLADTPMRES